MNDLVAAASGKRVKKITARLTGASERLVLKEANQTRENPAAIVCKCVEAQLLSHLTTDEQQLLPPPKRRGLSRRPTIHQPFTFRPTGRSLVCLVREAQISGDPIAAIVNNAIVATLESRSPEPPKKPAAVVCSTGLRDLLLAPCLHSPQPPRSIISPTTNLNNSPT